MSRSGFARRALPITILCVALVALVWAIVGAVVQPRVLADYREDYEDARFAREHPFLVRLTKEEDAARAAETFARDYEELEDAGYLMAPIRAATTAISHDKYQKLVDPTDRQKFEEERKAREKEEAEEDAERLREIEREEKEEKEE
jgi:hypothetical protein